MKTLRYIVCAAALGFGLAQASPAQATVSNASFAFCGSTCLFDPQSTGKAGDRADYIFRFTVPNGFYGGTGFASQNVGGHSIVIDGSSGKAPGTVFSGTGNSYQFGHGSAGYSVFGTQAVTNNGETVTITPRNGSINVPPGGQIELYSFTDAQTNGCTIGSGRKFTISTTADGPADTNTFSIAAGDPGQVTAEAGDDQSATVGGQFATDLQVKVADTCGNALSGKSVSLDTPDTGPSGTFAAGTPTTDSSGLATLPDLTANTVAGDWQATASVAGGSNPQVAFDLTNDPGAPNSADLTLEPATISADGNSTSTATLSVLDDFSNPIPGLDLNDISFSSSDAGHDFAPTSDDGGGDYSAQLTASTAAGDSTITGTVGEGIDEISDGATLTQTADTTSPTTTVHVGPGRKTNERKPTFYFSSDDETATSQCKVDDDRFKDCASPYTTPKLSFGKHTVSIRAEDTVGNTGAADTLTFKVVR